jgi:hypothetical protein
MEDYLNILAHGKQPQYFDKWKTTSIFGKWKMTSKFWQMKDYLNIFANGRQPQYCEKWKMIAQQLLVGSCPNLKLKLS